MDSLNRHLADGSHSLWKSYNEQVAIKSILTKTYVCRSGSQSLHGMSKIFVYYVSNGNVKIKIQENSRPLAISHTSDLEQLSRVLIGTHQDSFVESCCVDLTFRPCLCFSP